MVLFLLLARRTQTVFAVWFLSTSVHKKDECTQTLISKDFTFYMYIIYVLLDYKYMLNADE